MVVLIEEPMTVAEDFEHRASPGRKASYHGLELLAWECLSDGITGGNGAATVAETPRLAHDNSFNPLGAK